MEQDIIEILFSEALIKERVSRLGKQLARDYAGKTPLLLGVLKGCFVFMADLMRCIDQYCEIRFITASSYGNGTVSSGDVKIGELTQLDVEGRDVVIVEDIVDSGLTLKKLKESLLELRPASLRVCALLDKKSRREVEIDMDYIGFECRDVFCVGYGLDCAERYRNLPYIGVLKPEIYI
ncbi:MAG: hypoxanthine phosphoribosyltransferase [Oscillospiraceae bacterium]|jgi:hypoxanthine phosphoribosyltransferase|nr:hypoxanthine phosphoribosyltransferase [Oscillospiraceae bacterium]